MCAVDGTCAFVLPQESVDFAARIERMLRLSLGVDLSAEVVYEMMIHQLTIIS